jgi:pimeloyl-ACP methyl ester carboxylesterase
VAERSARRVSPVARRRLRRLAVGIGAAAAVGAASVAAEKLLVRRLRARPDPEAGEPLGSLPPEDLGMVRSFDGTEIAVRAAGPEDGPPVVFAHGFSLDMTTWYYQWRAFQDRYRCILFDARAHGSSGKPASGDYSLLAMGHDLKHVLDAAVPDGRAALIGHSMGGMAVVALAQEHPDVFGARVAGAVLSDTAVSDLLAEVLGTLGVQAGAALRRLGTRLTTRVDAVDRVLRGVRRYGADLSFLISWGTNFGPGASPSLVQYVTRLSQDAPVEVWVHTLQDLLQLDLRESLEHVTVPTLVVVGDRDLITPKTGAQVLRDALPDARAVAIGGAGHVAMMERHEVWNEIVAGHLERVFASRPRSDRRPSAASGS